MNWPIAFSAVAALAAVAMLLRLLIKDRDVSVIVGGRDEEGNFKKNELSVPSGEPIELAAVNLGGARAYLREVLLSFPPELDVRCPSGEWSRSDPDPKMPPGSTGWRYFIWTLPPNGRQPLPSIILEREKETYVPRFTQSRSEGLWGVWWRFLWWRSGRGSERLAVRVSVEPKSHE